MNIFVIIIKALLLSLLPTSLVQGQLLSNREFDGTANDKSIVRFGNARFTVLKENLIRCEYDVTKQFDDSPTFAIVNRKFPTPIFTTHVEDSTLYITTSVLQLRYEDLPPTTKKICKGGVQGFAGRNTVESPNYPDGTSTTSPAKCSELCEADEYCTSWSYDPSASENNCFLHFRVGYTTSKQGSIHGQMQLPTGFVPGSLSISIRDTKGRPFRGVHYDPRRRFNSTYTWHPGDKQKWNLNGTAESLDCYSNPDDCLRQSQEMHMPGLLSRDGWNVIYDERTPRFEEKKFSISLPWQWVKQSPTTNLDDLYFHAFPDLDYKQALKDVAEISGFPALPPRSIFGIWWSMYDVYSEETLNSEVLQGYADHDLPLEVLSLDMDWHNTFVDDGCSSWGNLDYNITLFRDPAKYVSSLRSGDNPTSRPLTVLLNLHSQTGIDHCHVRYRQVARAVGIDPDTKETVRCDNTDPNYVDALYDVYLDATPLDLTNYWWTDFNGCGGEMYNPLMWSNIVYSNYQSFVQDKRPMLLTRYGGLGNQRYPIGFSADALQHELALSWQIDKLAQSSNALYPYWSHDIGGFHPGDNNVGNSDPKNVTASEMYLRWIQFGVFSPFLRTHCDHCERRVWLFNHHFREMHDAFWLRTGLIPYIYTAARETLGTGVGLARPLYYEWPTQYEEVYAPENEGTYLFGSSILVSPIKTFSGKVSGSVEHTVWVPPGHWVNWNGVALDANSRTMNILQGPRYHTTEYSTAEIPVFVKKGSIIPLQIKDALTIGRPTAGIAWNVWPGSTDQVKEYTLYEDDGWSHVPQDTGPVRYSTKTVFARVLRDRREVEVVIQATDGTFPGKQNIRRQMVVLRDMLFERPESVRVNGKDIDEMEEGYPGIGWWMTREHSSLHPEGSVTVSLGHVFESANTVVKIIFKNQVPE